MIEAEKLKPLNKDVLLKMRPKTEVTQSLIYVKESIEESKLQFFDVLAIGDDVTAVNVGDVVVCDWTRITPPFEVKVDGKSAKVGITAEEEILAVVE